MAEFQHDRAKNWIDLRCWLLPRHFFRHERTASVRLCPFISSNGAHTMIVSVHDAKTHFSRLLEQAHTGQEVVLTKAGKPYARLLPPATASGKRQPGRLAGQVAGQFFEPLPDAELFG